MAAFQTYKSNTSRDNLRMTLHASMIDLHLPVKLMSITTKVRFIPGHDQVAGVHVL